MRHSPSASRLIASFLTLCCLLGAPTLADQAPAANAAEYLKELQRTNGAPGVSVAVALGGRIVFSLGSGYADLDNLVPATPVTVYNIGSVSKVMAAVAVMQLVEQGAVRLEDPIRKYVPAFPDKGRPITVWHIMTHTSGIRHYRSHDFPQGVEWDNVGTFASLAEAITLFKDDSLLFQPGAYYSYSSYAVNLLQGVVETASGMGFEAYMSQRVWGPAGMLTTQFDLPERIVPGRARGYKFESGQILNYYPNENLTYKFAGGGMISTAEDLVRFGVALIRGRLLRPETLKWMFTPQLEDVLQFQGSEPPDSLRWRQALMWRIRKDEQGRDFVHHCGSVKGFNACLVIYLEEDLVVATADNADVLGFGPALVLAEFFRTSPTKN